MAAFRKYSGVVALLIGIPGTIANDCASFGVNQIMQGPCEDLHKQTTAWPTVATFSGQLQWACELPKLSENGPSFALCDNNGLLHFWYGGSNLKTVSLAPFTTPVGAVYSEGKVYVACFGNFPSPLGTSGIAVVDVATERVEALHQFSNDGGVSHVHNVYAFEVEGKKEIFAATIGNPWKSPAVPGFGLSRLDASTGAFDSSYTTERLSVRSAVQQSDGSVFVLTQEPAGFPTKLARLEPRSGKFVVTTQTTLPPRTTGDGGADVFLGRQPNTLFAADRGAGPNGKGMVYYLTHTDGAFHRLAGHETGKNPRYTTMLANGDVASCNQDDNTIKVFLGLGNNPTGNDIEVTTFPAMKTVAFIIQSAALKPRQSHGLLLNASVIV